METKEQKKATREALLWALAFALCIILIGAAMEITREVQNGEYTINGSCGNIKFHNKTEFEHYWNTHCVQQETLEDLMRINFSIKNET